MMLRLLALMPLRVVLASFMASTTAATNISPAFAVRTGPHRLPKLGRGGQGGAPRRFNVPPAQK